MDSNRLIDHKRLQVTDELGQTPTTSNNAATAEYSLELITNTDKPASDIKQANSDCFTDNTSNKNSSTKSYALTALILVFGLSPWLNVTAVFVQLPLFVRLSVQGWALPSYLSLMLQAGNVAPLLFLALYKAWPRVFNERSAIYLILVAQLAGALVLCTHYALSPSSSSSGVLFACWIVFSLCSTCSTLANTPYLFRFTQPVYLTAYYLGMGCSSLFISCLALLQGVGSDPVCFNRTMKINETQNVTIQVRGEAGPPRFSISTFSGLVVCLLCASLASFAVFDNPHKIAPSFLRHIRQSGRKKDNTLNHNHANSPSPPSSQQQQQNEEFKRRNCLKCFFRSCSAGARNCSVVNAMGLVIVALISLYFNGLLPAFQTFATIPLGGSLSLHILAIGSQIANPIGSLITMRVFKLRSRVWLALAVPLLSLSLCLALLTYWTNRERREGATWPASLPYQILMITAWIVCSGTATFLNLILVIYFKSLSHAWMQLCAVSTQIGAFLGAIIAFLLINVVQIFPFSSSNST